MRGGPDLRADSLTAFLLLLAAVHLFFFFCPSDRAACYYPCRPRAGYGFRIIWDWLRRASAEGLAARSDSRQQRRFRLAASVAPMGCALLRRGDPGKNSGSVEVESGWPRVPVGCRSRPRGAGVRFQSKKPALPFRKRRRKVRRGNLSVPLTCTTILPLSPPSSRAEEDAGVCHRLRSGNCPDWGWVAICYPPSARLASPVLRSGPDSI